MQEVRAKLPQYFGALPKADLIIKRVPKNIEAAQPGGYYNNASLDGKRPGIYYINLRDTAEVPSWTLAHADLSRKHSRPSSCSSPSSRKRACR